MWSKSEKRSSLGSDEEDGFRSDDEDESTTMGPCPSFTRDEVLICATHGKIYAIRKQTGERLWRAKFPTGAMGGIVSVFVTDDDKLLVAANGKVACLNLYTGLTIWINKMKGCGYEEVGVICTPSRALPPRRPANELPGYTRKQAQDKPVVIACTRGKCLAVDAQTGHELWKFPCPKGGFRLPTALVEPASAEQGREEPLVYVGCGKWVYCLHARSGVLEWSVKISNATFGMGYMTLATPWSSRLSAEAHTAFSSFPAAQANDAERRRRQSSS